MKPRRRDKNFEDLYGDPYATRVPDGQYRVGYIGFVRIVVYGQKRWAAWFKITEEGPHFGKSLLRFYNEPTRAWIPRTHDLFLDFSALLDLRPPARITPDEYLKGTEVLAEVVTVHKRIEGKRGIEHPEALHYSKIERLLKYTAGSPPCARSGGKKQ